MTPRDGHVLPTSFGRAVCPLPRQVGGANNSELWAMRARPVTEKNGNQEEGAYIDVCVFEEGDFFFNVSASLFFSSSSSSFAVSSSPRPPLISCTQNETLHRADFLLFFFDAFRTCAQATGAFSSIHEELALGLRATRLLPRRRRRREHRRRILLCRKRKRGRRRRRGGRKERTRDEQTSVRDSLVIQNLLCQNPDSYCEHRTDKGREENATERTTEDGSKKQKDLGNQMYRHTDA